MTKHGMARDTYQLIRGSTMARWLNQRKDFPKVAGGFRSAGKPNEVCEVCHLAYT